MRFLKASFTGLTVMTARSVMRRDLLAVDDGDGSYYLSDRTFCVDVNFSTSARSWVRPLARLLTIRSCNDMTGTSSPSKSTICLFE